jgi:hypothetical protein
VYIGCALTSGDRTGLRDQLLNDTETVFLEAGFDVYNPCRVTKPGSPHQPNEVTAIDHLEAMRCDLIFFLRMQPSIGMGIEAQIAADVLTPWTDAKVAEEYFKLTPLVTGQPNSLAGARIIFDANDVDRFQAHLRNALKEGRWREHATQVRKCKDAAKAIIREWRLGFHIRRQRLLLQMTLCELASLVDLEPWWIASIEQEDELAPCLTLMAVMRLIDACRLRLIKPSIPTLILPELAPLDPFRDELLAGATEFAHYSLRTRHHSEPCVQDDESMLRHWAGWLRIEKQLDLPDVARNPVKPVSNLTACVAMPLSNLTDQEKEDCDRLIKSIESSLTNEPSLDVTIKLPSFQPTCRDESGSEIYLRMLERISGCDFGLIITTPPATGVGIMSRLFANLTMPCVSLANRHETISRMFEGMYFRRITDLIRVDSPDDAAQELVTNLTGQFGDIAASAARQRGTRDKVAKAGLARSVDLFRIPLGLSQTEAVAEFKKVEFVGDEWLGRLATSPQISPFVTLLQFVHIARSLSWAITVTESGVPSLLPSSAVGDSDIAHFSERQSLPFNERQIQAAQESLVNLLEARDTLNAQRLFPIGDEEIFNAWNAYIPELTLDSSDFETPQLVRTKEMWVKELDDQRQGDF